MKITLFRLLSQSPVRVELGADRYAQVVLLTQYSLELQYRVRFKEPVVPRISFGVIKTPAFPTKLPPDSFGYQRCVDEVLNQNPACGKP